MLAILLLVMVYGWAAEAYGRMPSPPFSMARARGQALFCPEHPPMNVRRYNVRSSQTDPS